MFDTLKYAEKLKAAGVDESVAIAKTQALSVALAGCGATKDDIAGIRIELADIKSDAKMMTRMFTVVAAVVLVILCRAGLNAMP
jgi:hypothetical protein